MPRADLERNIRCLYFSFGSEQGLDRHAGDKTGDDAGHIHADEHQEQADADGETMFHAGRNRIGQPRAQAAEGQQHESRSTDKHRPNALRPADM